MPGLPSEEEQVYDVRCNRNINTVEAGTGNWSESRLGQQCSPKRQCPPLPDCSRHVSLVVHAITPTIQVRTDAACYFMRMHGRLDIRLGSHSELLHPSSHKLR